MIASTGSLVIRVYGVRSGAFAVKAVHHHTHLVVLAPLDARTYSPCINCPRSMRACPFGPCELENILYKQPGCTLDFVDAVGPSRSAQVLSVFQPICSCVKGIVGVTLCWHRACSIHSLQAQCHHKEWATGSGYAEVDSEVD